MRVFCPEHKRGFFAPRQSPIKCENRGHILGELDFEGQAKLPFEIQWQYCCNCEHFCPVDFDQFGLERCPVCTRRSSLLYLCDRCHTICFESNTPLQTKNFTLTSEGAPQPSCPGCLQSASVDLHEHACDSLGASFITASNACPICEERLDLGPAFPSPVALYLKRTKSANKLNVTFDYETELFVPVEDGEFVVVSNGDQSIQPILLPRSARFSTRRDFYELYQDYYHCAKPDAGEVHVIQPAAVARVAAGWKLKTTGVLETMEDQPQKKAPAAVTHSRAETNREQPAPDIAEMKKESQVTPCVQCGSLIETRYAFCWKCGNPLRLEDEVPVPPREKPGTIMTLVETATDEDELTVQHDLRRVRSPMSSWASKAEPEQAGSARGSVLKLIAVAVVGLLLMSLGLFVLTRSDTRMASVTAAQPVTENVQSNPGVAPGGEVKREVAIESTPQRSSPLNPQDDELKKLRERRLAATASDRPRILKALTRMERQYPSDYRFPYERAKLAIKGSSARDKALKALSLAAEKAINAGKAREMLDGLEVDSAGDFNKLARGNHEWTRLLAALKRKDTGLLSAKAQ